MSYQSINPANGETYKHSRKPPTRSLKRRSKRPRPASKAGAILTFAERAAIANKAAEILRSRLDEFARPVTLEMGKRFEEAQAEVQLSADIIAYYAEHAEEFLAPEKLHPESGEAHIENSPLGVLFGVQPWNFPYYQLARFAAPNLMAGNVVMVKHSGTVPQCALAFEKLWREAGAPAGAYTNLFVSYDQVNRAIDDPRIKGVALTGSEDGGQGGRARGEKPQEIHLELGGSDAFIVLEDADLEGALKWALWAKMNNAGQCCIAAKRIIVVEEIADAFHGEIPKRDGGPRPR
jgi:succinate-semialdehyde dehydrogenase / glutarate-semialdehyde dehydrogenase